MIGDLRVAIETRIPLSTALELDRYDVERGMPMPAPRLGIDLNSLKLESVNKSHE